MTTSHMDDPHGLMLMGILSESVRTKGDRATAKWLGLDRRTILTCLEKGELSLKIRVALDNEVRKEVNAAQVEMRVLLEQLDTRIKGLELRCGELVKEFERWDTTIKAVRQEFAKENRALVRRIERLERRQDSETDSEAPPRSEPSRAGVAGMRRSDPGDPLSLGRGGTRIEVPEKPTRPWFPPRDHDEVVTMEAAPDDSYVYGRAWPLVREWRTLRRNHPGKGTTLTWMEKQQRLLVVEAALLDEHQLTLPPDDQPIDDLWRAHILNWKRSDLHALRRRILRRKLLRWARRLATFGIWWG